MSDKERLEETLKNPDIEERYLGIIRLLQEDRDQLMKQNKRYREAINNIIEKAMLFGTNEEVYDAIQDAIKVLEGTE